MAHVDGGCLSDEHERRLFYHQDAMDNLDDWALYKFYNEVRASLLLPTVDEIRSFSIKHYCNNGIMPIPYYKDIPEEYEHLMRWLIKKWNE